MRHVSTGQKCGGSFAATVLQIAAEVERDEAALRDRAAELIGVGDSARARRLLEQWKVRPAAEVLRLDASDQLD